MHTRWTIVNRLNDHTILGSNRSLFRIGRHQTEALDTAVRRPFPLAWDKNVFNDSLLQKFTGAGSKESTVSFGGMSEALTTGMSELYKNEGSRRTIAISMLLEACMRFLDALSNLTIRALTSGMLDK